AVKVGAARRTSRRTGGIDKALESSRKVRQARKDLIAIKVGRALQASRPTFQLFNLSTVQLAQAQPFNRRVRR
ncbi:MAG: hypothetical protein IKH04_09795, partial [Kiritimatiellae bacterium]|nr:hypothetical protein [Kiritimatiellia bacterium]